MIDQLVQCDIDLFLFLNGIGTNTWDGFWMFYTTKFNWIPFYALLLYLIYKRVTIKVFVMTIIIIVFLVTFTDQITNLFKRVLVMRPRPCYEDHLLAVMRLVKSTCGGRHGYFSGHSSNSMAVAVFVGLLLRDKLKYLIFGLLFWAALMGYSRIYIGVHYPLDVVSGMAFGALSGFMFYKLHNYIAKQERFIS